MILKASERGDGSQLARYLLAMRDNEHVELHEVRGFVSDDLRGAFSEADVIARGTRCKNHLFSMSLNPPAGTNVSVEAFEQAIAQIERKIGLEDQPRAIVFDEKDGRRHAHVVWSRIDAERMRAINLPHYKIKLRDVSRPCASAPSRGTAGAPRIAARQHTTETCRMFGALWLADVRIRMLTQSPGLRKARWQARELG